MSDGEWQPTDPRYTLEIRSIDQMALGPRRHGRTEAYWRAVAEDFTAALSAYGGATVENKPLGVTTLYVPVPLMQKALDDEEAPATRM